MSIIAALAGGILAGYLPALPVVPQEFQGAARGAAVGALASYVVPGLSLGVGALSGAVGGFIVPKLIVQFFARGEQRAAT